MQARYWLFMMLLQSLPAAHAEEAEPPLELIELLGEMEEEDTDLDIAMSDIHGKLNEKGVLPPEVKDDE
ncbi:MAG: hypothetical protein A2100_03860 [Sideroxydans sp. GWF2_59_14]|nr:MAG: hypothetical protein A2100_03860 [Sideroxydans sp. GWF2_59_14]HAF44388.1 hypothetical protein [Gallionellaceae bacterium]